MTSITVRRRQVTNTDAVSKIHFTAYFFSCSFIHFHDMYRVWVLTKTSLRMSLFFTEGIGEAENGDTELKKRKEGEWV